MKPTIKDYDGWIAARNLARANAVEQCGARWQYTPANGVWARLPAKWSSYKIFGRSVRTPRDQVIPAARFWPDGVLPIGPEYAAQRSMAVISGCDVGTPLPLAA
jgi:hypothetical protein